MSVYKGWLGKKNKQRSVNYRRCKPPKASTSEALLYARNAQNRRSPKHLKFILYKLIGLIIINSDISVF